MSKHTPPPWKLCIHADDPDGTEVYVPAGLGSYVIASSVGGQVYKDEDGRYTDYSEVEANARLIAAAPELLDALKQWKWAELNGDMDELDNSRRSRDLAIAKATGESA